jgi:hypothetical protein
LKNIRLYKTVTDQGRICFKEVKCLLTISLSWHKRLAAETHPADGELLQVAVKREEFPKLLGRTRIPVTAKRDGPHFKPE